MTTKKNYKSQKNNPTEKKKAGISPKKSFFQGVNLSANLLSIFTRIIFFLFSFWFLGVYNDELLHKLQAYSLFLYNPVFAGDTLDQSAGLLIYLSRFLTQFLYYPLLGALLLSLGLSGIEWWISRLFKIPSHYFYLSFIPPGLILLTQTSIGYALYYSFETSVVFSLVLGTLFALLLFTFYRKVRDFSYGIWIALLMIFSFYFVIGFYAFVALMMLLVERIVNKERYALWLTGSLLIGAFLSFVSVKYIFHETYASGLFSPLPHPFLKKLFIFSILSQVVLVFYSGFFFLKGIKEIKDSKDVKENGVLNKGVGVNFLLFCLSLLAVFHFSFRDREFKSELKLQRLVEKHEWDEVIKEAEKTQEPTKAIAAYRAIALAQTNQLSQRLFDFSYQYKPLVPDYMAKSFRKDYYYSELFFYASFPNVAYFWNMEFLTGVGVNFHLLKQMALCSMLNGEKELASRYLDLLKQSLFYKEWAEKQEQYNNNPDMLMKNPVYEQMRQYEPKENFVIPMNYSLPVYYKFLQRVSTKNMERYILACLYTSDLKTFAHIMQHIRTKEDLPVCVQEALLIYSIITNDSAILKRFKINKQLKENVTYCMNVYKKYGSNRDLAEQQLKKHKGTYCYFYLFSNIE